VDVVWSCSCAAVLETGQPLSALGFIKLANASVKVNGLFAERSVRGVLCEMSTLLALSVPGWSAGCWSSEIALCWGTVRNQNGALTLKTGARLRVVLTGTV